MTEQAPVPAGFIRLTPADDAEPHDAPDLRLQVSHIEGYFPHGSKGSYLRTAGRQYRVLETVADIDRLIRRD